MIYTSYEVKQRAGLRRHDPETRAQLGKSLRAMYRNLGLSRADCAKFLHVTERTLHNWESGVHDIPFAAYKLLRLFNGIDLPGASWAGWSISGGKLWTPEGFGLDPQDAAWWSLLVRRAQTGSQALRDLARLKRQLSAMATGNPDSDGDGASRAAAGAAAASSGGLVPYKTSQGTTTHEDLKCSQSDVTMTSWPILYDFPQPSTLSPESGPTISASALTPSSVSPWTPTCGVLLSLSRSPTSPHLAKIERPKQGPQSLHRPPQDPLKQVPKARSRKNRKASRQETPLVLPGQNAGSSPGCNGQNASPSGRPSGAHAPAPATATGGAA